MWQGQTKTAGKRHKKVHGKGMQKGDEPYARRMQDYCGLLSEEAVRKNFVLLYELLDEVIDYGYAQNSSSEALKEFVLNEPTVLKSSVRARLSCSLGQHMRLHAHQHGPAASPVTTGQNRLPMTTHKLACTTVQLQSWHYWQCFFPTSCMQEPMPLGVLHYLAH